VTVHWFALACGAALAIYVAVECAKSPARYRRLKQEIASGDAKARMRLYNEILRFEWISAGLAAAAVGFDVSKLRADGLGLADLPFVRAWSSFFEDSGGHFATGLAIGIGVALLASLVALKIARKRRRNKKALPAATPARKPRVLPDFAGMLPTNAMERARFALVALSAGICEEAVFRGWLMYALHDQAKLAGWALILASAGLFGVAHAYQGISGIIVTGMLGFIFCGLYVGSGTLFWPIALHALIDLRWAVFPIPQALRVDTPAATE